MSVSASATSMEGALAGVPDKMLIGGQWVGARSGRTLDVQDPATGRVVAAVPEGDGRDIDDAVKSARRTFESHAWRGMAPAERAKVLWRAADLIDAEAADIIRVEVIDNGMPLQLAAFTVAHGAETFRYFAGWITKIHGLTSEISGPGAKFHAFTVREPIGVAGLIIPWNGPFTFACSKLAVALAAGCSCVLKPAEETPLNALRLGRILEQAGVPSGVVNIVTGMGETAGAALAAHPDVDKIGFTGSTEVGRAIIKAAAGNLKKLTLELGGKSPVIVFEDADLETTIAGVATGVFTNSGQICIAGSRVYVHRKLYEPLLKGLAGAANGMKMGAGLDPKTQIGPLISAKQRDRVCGLINDGIRSGAQLAAGGKPVASDGYFVQPTVLANSPADSTVMREEIFGPVVSVLPFDDIEAVAAAANDTPYGLAAAVWTRDVSNAHAFAKLIRAGTVWVNCQLVYDLSIPNGGFKESGWGRESGFEGLEAYLQTKAVFVKI